MNTTTHHIAAEELMALVDGELTGAELKTVQEHVDVCALCAAEVAAYEAQQHAFAAWTVDAMPAAVESAIHTRLEAWTTNAALPAGRKPAPTEGGRSRRWQWGWAGGLSAATLAVLFVVLSTGHSARYSKFSSNAKPELLARGSAVSEGREPPPPPPPPPPAAPASAMKAKTAAIADKPAPAMQEAPQDAAPQRSRMIPMSQFTAPEVNAPMIARTVSLTLAVKDVERARESLDNLLRVTNSYAAQMQVTTPEGGARSLTASLRVPAGQLRGLLAELKGYGKVEEETQSGEEVGQQHADLAARLNTARESEVRLRGILKTRTGDVAEVLEVEQEIARVRGEIEGMEAEQQGLEHRVSYATVELQMHEDGPAAAPVTIGSRLAADAQAGWQNAVGLIVNAIALVLEYGLAMLLVLALLSVPAWLLWRRWQRAQARW